MTTASTFAPVLLPIAMILSAHAASGMALAHSRLASTASTRPAFPSIAKDESGVTSVSNVPMFQQRLAGNPELPYWLVSATSKLKSYIGAKDGWKGEGTRAPSNDAISFATDLLEQFAVEMPSLSSPMISPDDDGSICLYWRDDPMMAVVSVEADGTFSYYAEGHDEPARSDGSRVGSPLSLSLMKAMTAPDGFGILAA